MTVVAYDIASNKRRSHLVKLLEQYGTRINYSVFECMLTRQQKTHIINSINDIIDHKKDQVALYTICVDCYAQTEYLPPQKTKPSIVVVS